MPLPESTWIGKFSRLLPEVGIEVLSRLDLGRGRSLTELQLHSGEPVGVLLGALCSVPGVDDVEELEASPGHQHLRVTHRTSPFVPIFRDLRLIRRFPFLIRAGEASWVVVAPESKARALLARLREQSPASTCESVRHQETATVPGRLTDRQADLLRRAVAAGYFEVPRKITLTDLARNIGLAPSSLSEALAIVERKLLESWPTPAPP